MFEPREKAAAEGWAREQWLTKAKLYSLPVQLEGKEAPSFDICSSREGGG